MVREDGLRGGSKASGFLDRRIERTSLSSTARLTQQNWQSFDIVICDLSNAGFQAESAQPVEIGSYVMLDIPEIGPVRAQIRWQLGKKIGGMFLDPLRLGAGHRPPSQIGPL
jgi:hypothetical protein